MDEKNGKITSLDLSNQNIHCLEFLRGEDYSNLEELNLQNNLIRNFYRIDEGGKTVNFLDKLKQLKILNLSGNQLRDISSLQVLENLEELDLADNFFMRNYDVLNNLPKLKKLTLTHNEELDLSNKEITDIRFLGKLKDKEKLTKLNLSNNKIENIDVLKDPNRMLIFTNLKELFVQNNNFVINDNTLKDKIRKDENHFKIIFDSFSNLSEMPISSKVLLLGNHKAGKSTFLNHFYGIDYNGSTHILKIHKKDNINYFDFGGQDYYHGINQLFFNEKALNLLFWYDCENKNKNEYGGDSNFKDNKEAPIRNYNLEYWLYQIKYAIQKKKIESIIERDKEDTVEKIIEDINKERWNRSENPIVLIQTHADSQEETKKIDYFCDKFNSIDFNFINDLFVALPTLNDKGNETSSPEVIQKGSDFFKYLLTYFKEIVDKQKKERSYYYKEEWTILEQVNQIKEIRIKKEDERSDEEKKFISEKPTELKNKSNEQKDYFKNLHDAGEILFSSNQQLFFDPDPVDFTKKLYDDIFGKGLINKGRFYLSENGEVACSKKGEECKECSKECIKEIDEDIIEFLKQEKVIFKNINDNKKEEYIIPSYLPLATNNNDFTLLTCDFDKPDFTLKFLWFIPFGLINNLICYFGNLPDIKRYWRDNVIFTFLGRYKIWISLDFEKMSISVYVTEIKHGNHNNKEIELKEVEQFIFYQILNLYWSLFDDKFVDLLKNDDEKKEEYYARISKEIKDFLSIIKIVANNLNTNTFQTQLDEICLKYSKLDNNQDTGQETKEENIADEKTEDKISKIKQILKDKIKTLETPSQPLINELKTLKDDLANLEEVIEQQKNVEQIDKTIHYKNYKILSKLFPDDMYISVDNRWFAKYSEINDAESNSDTLCYTWKQPDEKTFQLDFEKPVYRALNQLKTYTMNKIVQKAKIFISYSHVDTEYKQQFERHLSSLKDEGIIVWTDEYTDLGNDWDKDIKRNLQEANIVIYLVSSDFIASNYIKNVETNREFIREKRLIPIIVRDCDWQNFNNKILGKVQAANHAQTLTTITNSIYPHLSEQKSGPQMDTFWANVVKDLRNLPEIKFALGT